jgi:glycosyltransferase involved in cell wall biosynthesis
MKVLIIINLCLGKSAVLPEKNLIKGLHSKGVDMTIIVHWPTPESLELESAGIRLIYQPITKKIDIPAICKIRSLLKEEKYDILHCTYSKAITNGLIASLGFDIKTVGYLGSLSLHWHDPFSYISFLNRRIDKLICLSDGVEEHALKQAPARMKDKTVRIYKGYDPEWLNDVVPARRKSLKIPDDAFVVCCVANIRKIKGVDWLIKSANFLPANLPVWFLLVGEKSNSWIVRRKIRRTKYPDNFITIGYSRDPLSFTSICDLYIQPSISEGLGRSVIEAMCLSKPVVVTDKGGAKELVQEDINGYVIPVRSAKAIADKITRCYENRDKLSAMGEKSRERILNDFQPRTTIESTYKLYVDLLGISL